MNTKGMILSSILSMMLAGCVGTTGSGSNPGTLPPTTNTPAPNPTQTVVPPTPTPKPTPTGTPVVQVLTITPPEAEYVISGISPNFTATVTGYLTVTKPTATLYYSQTGTPWSCAGPNGSGGGAGIEPYLSNSPDQGIYVPGVDQGFEFVPGRQYMVWATINAYPGSTPVTCIANYADPPNGASVSWTVVFPGIAGN